MSGVTFSVVIAAYQAADTVVAAVESALTQTRPPLEVIVVDDGSTDGTADVLAKLADQVVLLRQDNGGEAAAKNAGVHAARGEFVAILDADDLFAPTRLEALTAAIEARPDLDIFTTDAWVVDEASGERRRCYGPSFPFAWDDQPQEILRRNFILGLAAVRRAAVLDVGGYDPNIAVTTDWHLWIRMIQRGSRAGIVEQPLATYRLRADSLSGDPLRLLAGRLDSLRSIRRDLPLDPRLQDVLDDTIRHQSAALDRAQARRALVAGTPDARLLSWQVARSRQQPPGTRLKAAVAAAAPALVRSRVHAAERSAAGGFRAAGQSR